MDYNRIANNVAKKLAQYGRSVTLRQYPVGASQYNPSTLTVSIAGTTPTDTIRKALITEQPGTRIGPQYGTNTKPNSLIQDAQKWIYMDALGARPKPNDKVILDSVSYTITDVQETAPGGVPLFYLLVLNK
jgi:hypothetical protein